MMKSADPHTPHSTASLSPAAASLAEAAVILVSVIRRLAREATISFMHDSTGRCMHELGRPPIVCVTAAIKAVFSFSVIQAQARKHKCSSTLSVHEYATSANCNIACMLSD